MGKKDFAELVKATTTDTVPVVFGGEVTLMLAPRDYFPYKPEIVEQAVQYQSPAVTSVVNPVFAGLFQNPAPTESAHKVFPSAPDRIAVKTPVVKLSDRGDGSLDITTETEGARIYFTTDGSTPSASGTGSSMWYGLTKPHMDRRAGNMFHVRAIARKEGMKHSEVGEGKFDVTATPECTIAFAEPNAAQHDPYAFVEIIIKCPSENAMINYGITTGDASGLRATIRYDPANRPVFPINSENFTVVAKGIGSHLAWSDPVTASFTAPALQVPTISSVVSVDMAHFKFTCATPNVEYWYIIGQHQGDGTVADKAIPAIAGPDLTEPGPGTSDFSYAALSTQSPSTINLFASCVEPVTKEGESKYRMVQDAGKAKASVSVKLGGVGSTPIQVFARKAGTISSPVAFAAVTVQQCKRPTITPDTFEELTAMANNQQVTIVTETTDVKILYSLDGSNPSEGRKGTDEYDPKHPLRLFVSRDPKTIKVQVVKKNWVASEIVEKTYTRPVAPEYNIEGGLDLKGTFLHKKVSDPDAIDGPRRKRRQSVVAHPVIANGSFKLNVGGTGTKEVKEMLAVKTTDEYKSKELDSWKQRTTVVDTGAEHAKREAEHAAEKRRVQDAETIQKTFGTSRESGKIDDLTFEWLWAEATEDIELWHDFLIRAGARFEKHGDGPFQEFIADLGSLSQYKHKKATPPLIGVKDPKPFEPQASLSAGEERQKRIQRMKDLEQVNLKMRELDRVRSNVEKFVSVVSKVAFDLNLTKDELPVISTGLSWLRDRPKVLRGAKPSDRNPKHANMSHLEIFFTDLTEERKVDCIGLVEVLNALHPSAIRAREDAEYQQKKAEEDRLKAEKEAAAPAPVAELEGAASGLKSAFESGAANNSSALAKQADLDNSEGSVGEVRERMKGKLSNLLQQHTTKGLEAAKQRHLTQKLLRNLVPRKQKKRSRKWEPTFWMRSGKHQNGRKRTERRCRQALKHGTILQHKKRLRNLLGAKRRKLPNGRLRRINGILPERLCKTNCGIVCLQSVMVQLLFQESLRHLLTTLHSAFRSIALLMELLAKQKTILHTFFRKATMQL
jgi:hypothetical protein